MDADDDEDRDQRQFYVIRRESSAITTTAATEIELNWDLESGQQQQRMAFLCKLN